MFPLISSILGLLLVFVYILERWCTSLDEKQKSFLKTIPGPVYYPLIGSVLEFRNPTDLFPRLTEYMNKYGDVVKIWFGGSNLKIILSGYKEAEMLLSSPRHLLKTDDYKHLESWLGKGLLTSKPNQWRKFRKALTPAFHFQILEHFVDSFERPTNLLMKKLDQRVGEDSFDVHPILSLCSLDIICESSMGTIVDAQEDDESTYVKAVGEFARLSVERIFSVLIHMDFFYRLTRKYYREKKVVKILHGYTDSVIRQRNKVLAEKMNESHDFDPTLYGIKKLTLLDLLLLSRIDGEPIPDKAIRDEVDTFMFEGHDTTASGLAFTMYLFANHSEIQQIAVEEQLKLFGNEKNPKITIDELNAMKYLDLCIKESLRLYPPVPLIGRETTEDIEINDRRFPSGLKYYVHIYGIHRRADYFDDPETFNPMRFADMEKKSAFTYVPFSAGPRNCIGQRFAMLELKYVLSAVLRHFIMKPATPKSEPQLCLELVLKSKNGVNIRLEKRN